MVFDINSQLDGNPFRLKAEYHHSNIFSIIEILLENRYFKLHNIINIYWVHISSVYYFPRVNTSLHTFNYFISLCFILEGIKEYTNSVLLRIDCRWVSVEADIMTKLHYIFAAFLCSEILCCQALPYAASYLWLHKTLFHNYITWWLCGSLLH